jgi:membrane protein implicated in regulation of membrane protease activity
MPDVLVADGAAWFTVPAVVGTIFFLLRVAFLFIGGDAGIDSDVDLDHGDPTEAFKILSIQSVAAFMMGFGWGGIAGLRAFSWEWIPSMLLGIGIGVAMVWVLALLLKAVHDLQSSGNVTLENAVGAEGTVYARIPPRGEGRGQVQLVVDGRQRIYSAISDDEEIASQTRVRVIRVNEDRSLTVSRI